MVFNENEANEKWGLIIKKDKTLKLAPHFSYDFCAGVELTQKTHHRVIHGNREDIETFISKYADNLKEEFNCYISVSGGNL